jgi:hypothetical protein
MPSLSLVFGALNGTPNNFLVKFDAEISMKNTWQQINAPPETIIHFMKTEISHSLIVFAMV